MRPTVVPDSANQLMIVELYEYFQRFFHLSGNCAHILDD